MKPLRSRSQCRSRQPISSLPATAVRNEPLCWLVLPGPRLLFRIFSDHLINGLVDVGKRVFDSLGNLLQRHWRAFLQNSAPIRNDFSGARKPDERKCRFSRLHLPHRLLCQLFQKRAIPSGRPELACGE